MWEMARAVLVGATLAVAVGAATCDPVATCGDRTIDPGETCDGDCPASCDDGDPCTIDSLDGSAALCTARCTTAPQSTCLDDDGCCPAGCERTGDADCMLCSTTATGLSVRLPADEAAHSEALEWWYWTGHLRTDSGRWFGFHAVVFLSNIPGIWGQVGHAAITDIEDPSFHFAATFKAGRPLAVADGYSFALPQITIDGSGNSDVLHTEVDDYVLDLELASLKSPVYQYGVGYTDYPFGGNTYYYSREHMAAGGRLAIGDDELTVSGRAWFDHQWGALSDAQDIGWDWFALQLDDSREIMLAIIRATPPVVTGSYTDADCHTVDLDDTQIAVVATGEWTSPHTNRVYPSGWDISVMEMRFHLTPVLPDQELFDVLPGVDYWEGACSVTGDANGRAYVELTGYPTGP